jgi:hypothetical protein
MVHYGYLFHGIFEIPNSKHQIPNKSQICPFFQHPIIPIGAKSLSSIFVTSIKAAEKKPRLGVVECSVLDVCFSFDIGRSMFDVRRSSLKTTPLTCPFEFPEGNPIQQGVSQKFRNHNNIC